MLTASTIVDSSAYFPANSTRYTASTEAIRPSPDLDGGRSGVTYTYISSWSFNTDYTTNIGATAKYTQVSKERVTYSNTSIGEDGESGYTIASTFETWIESSTRKASRYRFASLTASGGLSATWNNTTHETTYPETTVSLLDTSGTYPSTTVLTQNVTYNDTDTYLQSYEMPIISANASGTYSTVSLTSTISTSSSQGTLLSQTLLGTSMQPMTISVGQTIIPAYYAQSNESLYLQIPVTGRPRLTVEFSSAFIPVGGSSYRGYWLNAPNNATSVLTIPVFSEVTYKSTYTVTTSPLTLTLTYIGSTSFLGTTTMQADSTFSDGRLNVTTETIGHTYYSTQTSEATYPKTGTSTATRVGTIIGGFGGATTPINVFTDYSTMNGTTFNYGGYTFGHGSAGLDVSSATLLNDSSLSYSTLSTASLKKVSQSYSIETYTNPPLGLGGSTSTQTIDGNSTTVVQANSTVHALSMLCNSDNYTSVYRRASLYPLSYVTSTQNTMRFGEAITYEGGNVIPSTDMRYSNGWGIGISVPSALSEVAYVTSSVYNGVVYATTVPRSYTATTTSSVRASQSINSITVTYRSTNSASEPAIATSSFSGLFDNILPWGKTYFTDLGGTFVNNGFLGVPNVTLALRGDMQVTSFNSTGGNTSSWTSAYNGKITITGGDGYCFYSRTSGSVFALHHFTVGKQNRGITAFTKT